MNPATMVTCSEIVTCITMTYNASRLYIPVDLETTVRYDVRAGAGTKHRFIELRIYFVKHREYGGMVTQVGSWNVGKLHEAI
jgi:hypothetical protein